MSRVKYIEGFRTLQVQPEWQDDVGEAINKVVSRRDTYEKVERNTGIPWVYVAAIHYRESGCDFQKQIFNGERWDQETKLVPAGYGPWDSWGSSAVDALRLRHKPGEHGLHDVDTMLANLESWNGWGYRKLDKNSPYLWSGSQYGVGVGKYVADGNYSEKAEDKQVGAAVLIHELMRLGYWSPTHDLYMLPIWPDDNGVYITERAMKFQEALNLALKDTLVAPLVVDGWVGKKTQYAFTALTGCTLVGGA